jgi:hypothetical protein
VVQPVVTQKQSNATLRRSVYLRACDVAAEALQFVANLSDENITLEQCTPLMRRLAGLTSKLDMLADKESIAKLTAYQTAYYDEYAALVPAKRILEMRAATIEWLKQRLLNLSQMPPTRQGGYEATKKFLEEEIARLQQRNQEEQHDLFKRSIGVTDRLSDKAAKVAMALRRELGLKIDEDWFRNTVAASVRIGQARQERLLAEMDERLKKEREATEQALSRKPCGSDDTVIPVYDDGVIETARALRRFQRVVKLRGCRVAVF